MKKTHIIELNKPDNKNSYHVYCSTLGINVQVCQTEIEWFLDRYINKGLNLEIVSI